VLDPSGADLTPSGIRQRSLLGALLLHRNRVVAVDRLAELVWGDELPADHTAAVQTHIHRLRRILPSGVIEQVPPGYRLMVDGARLVTDVDEVERWVAEAGAALPIDQPGALARLDRALGSWRGAPFEELAGRGEAIVEAARLDDLRTRAEEARWSLLVDLGRGSDVVAELEDAARRDPLRDRPAELLMLALLSAGRRADSLRAYEHHRRALAHDLGIEPSAHLQDLHRRLLDGGGPDGDRRTASSFPAPAVPQPGVELVGRERLAATIDEALARSRLVTLVGTGGVGKTSVALAAARRWADECQVVVLELAGCMPGNLDAHVHTAAGIEPREGIPAGSRLGDLLRGRPALVVLDNCEHVLDDAARLVDDLCSRTDDVVVLATSRERLARPGEHLVPVPPLPWTGDDAVLAPAVRLFAQRARETDAAFRLDEGTTPVVTQICRHLDGLPLAIELAATRLHAVALEEIRDGLATSHALLSGGRRTVARHRSMAAAMAWSYELLALEHRRLFGALSVFGSRFDSHDAASVVDQPVDVVRPAIAALVEASLVQRHGDRYSMLQPVRQFAATVRTDDATADDVSARHAARIGTRAGLLARRSRTTRAAEAFEASRAMLPDLRTAFAWAMERGDLDLAWQICQGCRDTAVQALVPEPFAWARELALAAVAAEHPCGPAALGIAALGAWKSGRVELAGSYLMEARAETERLGLEPAHSVVDMGGTYALSNGRLDEAVDAYREAIELAERAGEHLWVCESSATWVLAKAYRHDDDAISAADRLVDELIDSECLVGEAWCWYGAGEAVASTDPERGRERLTRAVEVARVAGARFPEVLAAATLASLAARHGDPEAAVAHYRDLLPLLQRGGAVSPLWTALRSIAELLDRCERPREAAVLYGAVTDPPVGHRVYGDDAQLLGSLHERLSHRLGPDEVARRIADGAALDDSGAIALVTAAFDALG
jgi:predicted ATPase/DNA-binding SARP family transcriptional activator